jgi:hypothetical protein
MVGGLADHLLDLVARPGDGFAGKLLLAAGEWKEVDPRGAPLSRTTSETVVA